MRTLLVLTLAAACSLLLQTTLLQTLRLDAAVPDILLVLVVYLGLYQHTAGGACGAFVLGYMEDSLSGTVVGLNAFAMSLVFLLVYLTSRRLWVDNVVSRVVVVFLASLVKIAGVMVLLALFFSLDVAWSAFLRSLLIQPLVASLLAPPIFALLGRVYRPDEADAG